MMNRRVVGVFDDRSQAELARKDLLDVGFDRANVDLSYEGATAGTERAKEPGFWESIKEMFGFEENATYSEAARRGHVIVAVNCPEDRVEQVSDILHRHSPVDLDERAAEWRKSGWTGQAATGQTKTGQTATGQTATGEPLKGKTYDQPITGKGAAERPMAGRTSSEQESIPIIEEQLRIDKERTRQGGVRVYSHVTEKPVEADVRLQEETVDVTRRKVDRPASGADFREQTIEAQGFTEEPVVSKETRVVEEVVISKQKGERTQKVRDTVRRTDVDVQQLDKDYRQDFEQRYASHGYTYDQSRAAYNYGQQLAEHPSYSGRDWADMEPEARRMFEEKNPGRWDEFKDAIRHAFERAQQRKAA